MATPAIVNKFHDSLGSVNREWAAPCSFKMLGFVRVVLGGFSFEVTFGRASFLNFSCWKDERQICDDYKRPGLANIKIEVVYLGNPSKRNGRGHAYGKGIIPSAWCRQRDNRMVGALGLRGLWSVDRGKRLALWRMPVLQCRTPAYQDCLH